MMVNRLTKIYTRTGDKGETGLSGGKRIRKDCPEIQAIGDVDELNSVLGMVIACDLSDELKSILIKIQHQLFNVGAELNSAKFKLIHQRDIDELENHIDDFNQTLSPLKNFILPSGGHAAATCHLARAVCRRAERSVVALDESQGLNPTIQIYLNRLSDFLFVFSRVLAKYVGEPETLWSSDS
jgi:cob(I)alamin adenosyltransferase